MLRSIEDSAPKVSRFAIRCSSKEDLQKHKGWIKLPALLPSPFSDRHAQGIASNYEKGYWYANISHQQVRLSSYIPQRHHHWDLFEFKKVHQNIIKRINFSIWTNKL